MSSDLQSEAIDLIVSAIDKQRGNYEGAARQVKEQMDRKFGPSWHCVMGEGFGSITSAPTAPPAVLNAHLL